MTARQRLPETIGDALSAAAAPAPDKLALVSMNERLTYAQLDRRVEQAAGALHKLGIRMGDRVSASLSNSTDLVVAFYASARLGAIWVGINRQLAAPEKSFILKDCGVKVFIAQSDTLAPLKSDHPDLCMIVCNASRDARDEWRQMLDAAEKYPRPRVDSSDPGGIAYTSGTTGRPKGVMHSHRNLLIPGAALKATRPGYGPEIIKTDFLPLTILNVTVLTALLVCQAGGTLVILDTYDPVVIAEWIAREKATCLSCVPPVLHGMVVKDNIAPSQLASMREVLVGGAATPEPLLDAFKRKFGVTVVGGYGLTEAPAVLTLEAPGAGDHTPNSNGKALPHVELFAEGPAGKRLGPGENGEICVTGAQSGPWAGLYTFMLGYWNKPDATAETLRNGRLHTGDVGYLDAEGRVYITDRKNLVIIRGGANVYPAEIQRVLAMDNRIADSAAFGVPDERLGERVVAAVELVPGKAATEAELRRLCEDNLARYKVPERIIFVEQFTRNAMNKIVRDTLPGLYARAAATQKSG